MPLARKIVLLCNVFRWVVAAPGVLLIVMGMRWLVNPAGIAPELGLRLETGLGLSTQVGDLSAFFLVTGVSMLIAAVAQRRVWCYPPALLMLLASIGRVVAWVLHDAALALPMIGFELAVAALLLTLSRLLPEAT